MRKHKVIQFYSPINSGGCADYTLEITEFKNGKRRFRATETICSKPYLYVSSTNMSEEEFLNKHFSNRMNWRINQYQWEE